MNGEHVWIEWFNHEWQCIFCREKRITLDKAELPVIGCVPKPPTEAELERVFVLATKIADSLEESG